MIDHDYTRDITTDCSDDDDDSIYDVDDDNEIYQSTQSLADSNYEEDEIDRFEKGKTREELKEIYGTTSSDEEKSNAGPSNTTKDRQRVEEEEEKFIAGQQYRQNVTLDVSDDMSPNATSTGDEQERGRNTPGVSDEVHKMSIVEEANEEQQMEIEEEEKGAAGEEKEKERKSERKTKRTPPSRRKKR